MILFQYHNKPHNNILATCSCLQCKSVYMQMYICKNNDKSIKGHFCTRITKQDDVKRQGNPCQICGRFFSFSVTKTSTFEAFIVQSSFLSSSNYYYLKCVHNIIVFRCNVDRHIQKLQFIKKDTLLPVCYILNS